MVRKWHNRKRAARRHTSVLALPFLTALSVLLTVSAAAVQHPRLPWLVAISLLFIFLTVSFRGNVKVAISTLKHHHATRKRKAHTRGKVLEFPQENKG
ncbi:MAG: hypothetical protein RR482_06810 [Clostridia bacterium]